MSQYDHKIFFDIEKTEHLLGIRGSVFDSLIQDVLNSPDESVKRAGFVLFISGLSICDTCDINQYRAASRGCALCAEDSLRRAEASDEKLIQIYNKSVLQIQNYLKDS